MSISPRTLLAALGVALVAFSASVRVADDPESQVLAGLRAARLIATVPAPLFDRLGWDLPDRGAHVKAVADQAPDGAFDPHALARLDPETLGYTPTWHVVRYRDYGLEWDVTALKLTPRHPAPGLPTVAFINGGSANFYEFFVTPLNEPAVGQYLAQRVPVLLVTIPGNYKPGGWIDPYDQRRPAYLLDRDLPADEVRLRNAIFTFRVVSDGVARVIEEATTGPVLISGHSTGGEIQFLLRDRLKSRLQGMSLGWGTGGPASVRRTWEDDAAAERNRTERQRIYPPIADVRARTTEEYVRSYVRPLNPLGPGTAQQIAERWFAREQRRRPQFKQLLQDLEHRGEQEQRPAIEREIRALAKASPLKVPVDEIVADLFSTLRTPLTGYRRMAWTTAMGDDGHWDADPAKARERFVAEGFRTANPDAALRILVFDVPMSHYGHIERPRQLAGGILAAVKWLYEK